MSINLQHQIKNNSTDIRNYIDDLYSWEDSKKKSKPVSSNKDKLKNDQPIRGNASENLKQEKENKSTVKTKLKRDGNTISDYYKEWDRLDLDKELEEDNQENITKQSNKPVMDNPFDTKSKAKPKAEMIIKGGRTISNNIESIKDRANMHYRNVEYEKSLELYTECISKFDLNEKRDDIKLSYAVIYANRAINYIKLQDYCKAENDCNSAINLYDKYSKSYVRRATCKKKMGKIKLALEDLNIALKLEPDNIDIKREIENVELAIKTKIEKSRNNLILKQRMSDKFAHKIKTIDINDKNEKINDFPKSINNLSYTLETKEKSPIKIIQNQPLKDSTLIKENQNTEIQSFLNLKNIDKIQKTHKINENINPDQSSSHKVHFCGEIDLENQVFKREPFNPNKKPKKSIIKNLKPIIRKENKRVTIENIIENTKNEFKENLLKEKINFEEMSSSKFLNQWKNISKDKEIAFKFLKSINYTNFASIFKENIDVNIFMEIITILNFNIEGNENIVKDFLINMTKIRRFEITISCLISKEKQEIREIFEKLKQKDLLEESLILELTKIYKI